MPAVSEGTGPAPAHTDDTLLGGRIRLRQPQDGYRVAIDPVLLAAAVPAAAGETVLDVGTGTGAALLCLAGRVPGTRLVGLERQDELAALAEVNVTENGFADRARIVTGDLRQDDSFAPESFDHVMANPPFTPQGDGTVSPKATKSAAHQEDGAGLGDWLDVCLRLVRPKGSVTIIHRPERIAALLAGLNGRAGAVVIFPLWPKAGRPARRVIVCARKGIRTPARIDAGLVLHDADGAFTAAAEAVLTGGAALDV